MSYRLIRFNEVSDKTGLKRTWIYSKIAKGEFPAPVKIGTASRWRDDEIKAWQDEQSAARSAAQSAL